MAALNKSQGIFSSFDPEMEIEKCLDFLYNLPEAVVLSECFSVLVSDFVSSASAAVTGGDLFGVSAVQLRVELGASDISESLSAGQLEDVIGSIGELDELLSEARSLKLVFPSAPDLVSRLISSDGDCALNSADDRKLLEGLFEGRAWTSEPRTKEVVFQAKGRALGEDHSHYHYRMYTKVKGPRLRSGLAVTTYYRY